jgi:hypothetical protein
MEGTDALKEPVSCVSLEAEYKSKTEMVLREGGAGGEETACLNAGQKMKYKRNQ